MFQEFTLFNYPAAPSAKEMWDWANISNGSKKSKLPHKKGHNKGCFGQSNINRKLKGIYGKRY